MPSISVSVAIGADDGARYGTVNYEPTGVNLWRGWYQSLPMGSYMRFQLAIPQGAIIESAVLTEVAGHAGSGVLADIQVAVWGVAEDNSATISSWADWGNRTRTAAKVHHEWASWTLGTEYPWPDISAVIQEIVDRPGWVSGNHIVLMVDNDGGSGANAYRGSASFEHTSYAPPLLEVTYSTTQEEEGHGTTAEVTVIPEGNGEVISGAADPIAFLNRYDGAFQAHYGHQITDTYYTDTYGDTYVDIPSLAGPLGVETDLGGMLDVVPADIAAILAVETDFGGGLVLVPESVTSGIALETNLAGMLGALVSTVSSGLGIETELAGTLDLVPAIVESSLDVEPEFIGSLGAVPETISATLAVETEFLGGITMPTAIVYAIQSSLGAEIEFISRIRPTSSDLDGPLDIKVGINPVIDAVVASIQGILDPGIEIGGELGALTSVVSADLTLETDLVPTVTYVTPILYTAHSQLAIETDLGGALHALVSVVHSALQIEVELHPVLDAQVSTVNSGIVIETDLGGAITMPIAIVYAVGGSADLVIEFLPVLNLGINHIRAPLDIITEFGGVVSKFLLWDLDTIYPRHLVDWSRHEEVRAGISLAHREGEIE